MAGSSHNETVTITPAGKRLAKCRALTLALLLLAPLIGHPQHLRVDSGTDHASLAGHLEHLAEGGPGLHLDEVRQRESGWQRIDVDSISLGIGQHDHWFRFQVENAADRQLDMLLEIAYASLDHIRVHVLDDGHLTTLHEMGDHFPFYHRPLEHPFFITPLSLPEGESRDIYLNIRTGGAMQLPIALWSHNGFIRHDQRRQLAAGLYFGTMLVILVYNLFMFVGIGDRSYIYYVGFVLSLPLFVASLQGYTYQYFWPNASNWNERSIGFFLTTTVLFGLLFTRDFLNLQREGVPLFIRWGMAGLSVIIAGMLAMVFMAPYTLMLTSVIAGAVVACAASLSIGVYGWWWQTERAYRYYLLAWAALLIGGIILAANKFSLLPQNIFTDNAVQFGSTLLVVLLSFAMAARINEERQRVHLAQIASLEYERQARKAREDALKTERDAKRMLEIKVDERTRDLQKANAILEDLSARDALTGLHNRRYFDDQLLREYVRCYRYQKPLALVVADIDHFKQFNDSYGHLVGDDCLRIVASLLQESVTRATDVLVRFGGEEFCILLPDTEMAGARAVAERVREKISGSAFMVKGERIPLTISLGVCAQIPASPEDAEKLIERADRALYESKRSGRNRVTCCDELRESAELQDTSE